MGNRLSKIYTKTGDDGTTGLGDGSRVDKDGLRVEAYGTVDEANSAIGIVLTMPSMTPFIEDSLTNVQHDLFELGGELCIPGHEAIAEEFINRLDRDQRAQCRSHQALDCKRSPVDALQCAFERSVHRASLQFCSGRCVLTLLVL